jgi:5-methylcytosine-specific restriction endonuclease McrA
MTFRDFKADQRKSPAEMIKAQDLKCQFCGNPVTKFKGPGDQTCCRECQKKLKEYGGYLVQSVKYSHARADGICAKCGYNPEEDPEIMEVMEVNPKLGNSIARGMLETDHIDGNHLNNDPANLQALCTRCHRKKTLINGDNLTPTYIVESSTADA